jgi:hypothetical protein
MANVVLKPGVRNARFVAPDQQSARVAMVEISRSTPDIEVILIIVAAACANTM